MKSGFIYESYENFLLIEKMYRGCLRSRRIAMKIQVSRCFLDTEESMQRYYKITLADFTFKVHFMSLVFSVAPRPGITRLQIRFTPPL